MEHELNLLDSFDALLICNGAPPDRSVVRDLSVRARRIVCADGGANTARTFDVQPHLILGDLDSITVDNRSWFERKGVEIRYDGGQDDTDFEKSLRYLRSERVSTLVIAGMTGLLLDHTLGNFSILQRYVHDFRIVLIDPRHRIDVITRSTSFASAAGDRISIVPFPRASGASYEGLLYPLDDAEMIYGLMEGTCNEATGSSFSVSVRDGALLVFRPMRVWT